MPSTPDGRCRAKDVLNLGWSGLLIIGVVMSMSQLSSFSHLANGLSITRLAVAPLVVWLLLQRYDAVALAVFVVAALSDAADGFLARHVAGVSQMGAILDSVADKVMIVGVYVTLGFLNLLPEWLVFLVIVRDFIIVGGAAVTFFFWRRLFPTQPMIFSKINTVAQIFLAATVMAGMVMGTPWSVVIDFLIIAVAVTTIGSGLLYLGRWFGRLLYSFNSQT